MVDPVPGGEALGQAPLLRGLADLVDDLGGEDVGGHLVDVVPAAGTVKAEQEVAVVGRPERVLHLVAVAPLVHGPDDRRHVRRLEPADPLESVADLLLLLLQLARIGEHLPRGARVGRPRLDPVGPRLDDLDQSRLGVGALPLLDGRAHEVARHRARARTPRSRPGGPRRRLRAPSSRRGPPRQRRAPVEPAPRRCPRSSLVEAQPSFEPIAFRTDLRLALRFS